MTPAAVIALRALRSIVNEDPADRVLRDWQVEAHEYLDRLDALPARVELQDCGLSANDIYHVMLAWEQQPASDEQTRIVTGLGKLREQFIQLGDSPYVTVPATARVEPPPQEQDWQPIATAPKDGTMILVYPSSTWTDDTEGDYEVSYWDSEMSEWHHWCTPDDYNEPTHWMSLPAPPLSVLAAHRAPPAQGPTK